MKWLLVFFSCVLFASQSFDRRGAAPFISGDDFRSLAHHIYDEETTSFDPESVKDGEIIFVKTDLLKDFFEKKHPFILAYYVLITHNSDFPSPGPFYDWLDEPNILHWFAQNADASHPKLTAIPIGIANAYTPHGDAETIQKMRNLVPKKKTRLCYLNFSVGTNPAVRGPAYKQFRRMGKPAKLRPFLSYLAEMGDHMYAASPPGNGLDCHRTWEALYMGVVPIVLRNTLSPLFEGLPILEVDTWDELSTSFLRDVYPAIRAKKKRSASLFFPYWKQKIEEACILPSSAL